MKKIIALVGLPGCGKSEAAKILAKLGFISIRFGDITDIELEKRGLEINEANEKDFRVQIRKELGQDAYAQLNIPRIEPHEQVVVDGLRSYREFTTLKDSFGDAVQLLVIDASPEVRYARLAERKVRPLTEAECKERDHNELYTLGVKETLEKAQLRVKNESTLEDLETELKRIIQSQ